MTQTLNEPPSPATLVMDTNPWLTYLILLSPLPVVFLSAFPHRAVIRHVGNTREKKKKEKNVYFPIASACATRDGGYTCRVLFVPRRHQRMVATILLLAAGAWLDQRTLTLEERRVHANVADLTSFFTGFRILHTRQVSPFLAFTISIYHLLSITPPLPICFCSTNYRPHHPS